MIVPGIAPMYVRRWPRISDSSRTPPTEMRDELAARARGRSTGRARSCRRPGGPTKQRIGPERSFFSFETARYSMIRSFTLSRSKWSSSRISRAWSRSRLSSVCSVPRQREDPVEVGADDAVLGRGRRQLLEPRRARGSPPSAPSLGQVLRLDPLAQLVRPPPAARRPRRAPPGSPSAAGGGRTRAGPSRSRSRPATGSSSRARTSRARG